MENSLQVNSKTKGSVLRTSGAAGASAVGISEAVHRAVVEGSPGVSVHDSHSLPQLAPAILH